MLGHFDPMVRLRAMRACAAEYKLNKSKGIVGHKLSQLFFEPDSHFWQSR